MMSLGHSATINVNFFSHFRIRETSNISVSGHLLPRLHSKSKHLQICLFLIAESKKLLISFQKVYNVVKSFLKEHSHFNTPVFSRDIYEEVKWNATKVRKLLKKCRENAGL